MRWPFKKKIRILIVDMPRNQIIDLQNNLKKIIKFCDDPKTPGRYVMNNFLVSKGVLIQLRVDRGGGKNEKSTSH